MLALLLRPLHIFVVAGLFRIGLLKYGDWQDSNLDVKFTDVDYHVFADAAEFVSMGESPYKRATYRYSPLLAWMLIPNTYIHKSWGKFLFVFFDLLTGMLIKLVLSHRKTQQNVTNLALVVWLFNPLTATVSCRGNAESILSAILIGMVYALQLKETFLAGFLFALSVHLKIYPIIYSLALFLYLGSHYNGYKGVMNMQNIFYNLKNFKFVILFQTFFSKERLKFLISSSITFIILTTVMYVLYGYDFLEHTYLYHVTRRDVRHNFSPYFYMLYINTNQFLSLVCFIYQVIVIVALSVTLYNDLPFCMFLLTSSFVTFNKICTSQYFLWYLTFLPLVVSGLNHVSLKQTMCLITLWLFGQGVWLFPAYCLEFLGLNTFVFLWLASLLFFLINVYIICWFIRNYKCNFVFTSNSKLINFKQD